MNPPDITIRHAEPGDFEAMQRIHAGARAVAGTLQLPYPSVESWRKRLSDPQSGFYSLVACTKDEVVGTLGISTTSRPRRRHVAQLFMTVLDDWQGKGVGSALMTAALELADNWLEVRRIELEVFTDNAPGVALYKKFGFVIEGTLREFAFRNGSYADVYAMARLRPEA